MTVFQRIHVGEFIQSTPKSGIVATGTNQATAYKLPNAEMFLVGTVAAGAGVMLPPAKGGLDLIVVNFGANPLQVYGQPGDMINAIASATGVQMMVDSFVIFSCFADGSWYTADLATGFATVPGAFATFATSAITAATTHTQAAATPILTMNVGVTVGNASDGVLLPTAQVGMEITIVNLSAANAMQVYATGANTINGTAGATGVSQAANAVTIYFCVVAGAWVSK